MDLKLIGCTSADTPGVSYGHTSFAIESGTGVYWFDAGEGCSNTAHLMGIELTSVSNVFISEWHINRTGGLFSLLWFMFKLSAWRKKPLPNEGKIGVFVPDMQGFEGILQMLMHTRENCPWDTDLIVKELKNDMIYADDNIKLTAHCNNAGASQRSFSFKISSGEKSMVFSGCARKLKNLDYLLEDKCDFLLLEAGNHSLKEICEYINTKQIQNAVLINCTGSEFSNITRCELEAQKYSKCNIIFGKSGDSITI